MTKRIAVMVAALSLTLCGWAQQPLTMTVEELFERVEQHSMSLKVLRTNEAVAAEGVEEARNQRLPDINSSLSVSYIGNVLLTNREFGDVHGYSSPHFGNSFSVEAQQVVYAGGAVDAGIKMAGLRREQATLGVETMRQRLCFLALGQFLELFKLHNSIRVFDSNIQLTDQLLADCVVAEEGGRHSTAVRPCQDAIRRVPQQVARIIDANDVWVVANYHEKQLRHINVGHQVEFRADAVPGVVFHGEVESIAGATGGALSGIPVDNATGNFVKVEQRVPVRIKVTDQSDQTVMLLAGLNV